MSNAELIEIITTQRSTQDAQPYDCSGGLCGCPNYYWASGAGCVPPSISKCPTWGITKPVENPGPLFKEKCVYEKSCDLSCFYNKEEFTTLQAVKEYKDALASRRIFNPNTDEQWREVIMPLFCSQAMTGAQFCPRDNQIRVEGEKVAGCSMLNSKDEGGELCRNWLNYVKRSNDPSLADQLMENFVSRYYPEEEDFGGEASCINRSRNPIYQVVGRYQTYKDSCWFAPCRGGDPKVLVPSDLRLNAGDCPTHICQAIIDIANSQGAYKFDDVNTVINCNNITPASGPNPPPSPKPPIPSKGVNPVLIIGVILLIIAVIIGIVLAVRRRRK